MGSSGLGLPVPIPAERSSFRPQTGPMQKLAVSNQAGCARQQAEKERHIRLPPRIFVRFIRPNHDKHTCFTMKMLPTFKEFQDTLRHHCKLLVESDGDPTAREAIEGIKSFITIMGALDAPEPKWDDSQSLQISYIDEEGDEIMVNTEDEFEEMKRVDEKFQKVRSMLQVRVTPKPNAKRVDDSQVLLRALGSTQAGREYMEAKGGEKTEKRSLDPPREGTEGGCARCGTLEKRLSQVEEKLKQTEEGFSAVITGYKQFTEELVTGLIERMKGEVREEIREAIRSELSSIHASGPHSTSGSRIENEGQTMEDDGHKPPPADVQQEMKELRAWIEDSLTMAESMEGKGIVEDVEEVEDMVSNWSGDGEDFEVIPIPDCFTLGDESSLHSTATAFGEEELEAPLKTEAIKIPLPTYGGDSRGDTRTFVTPANTPNQASLSTSMVDTEAIIHSVTALAAEQAEQVERVEQSHAQELQDEGPNTGSSKESNQENSLPNRKKDPMEDLVEMGFANRERNKELLRLYDNDLTAVINALVSEQTAPDMHFVADRVEEEEEEEEEEEARRAAHSRDVRLRERSE
ncbi:unnamed protein product [Darwinula stevensoni]|uniref:UBA domain-containing protein n=1 Tax=Darwinula stevensoni TaxID=69355 RepID=A0A7R9A408_9CRUS|nr:unnamed protein product [Darwinula stevensoni]CAG0891597.1 unnamed protein product [Darwinula stevensoni]